MHRHDYIEPLRRRLLPLLHGFLSLLGLYSVTDVTERQYVATVEFVEPQLELYLHHLGFYRNPLSALKRHPDGRVSQGSWFYLPDGLLSTRQYHLTLLDGETGVDCYLHEEVFWGHDPVAHLDATDVTYPDEWLRMKFARAGIPYHRNDI